MPDTRLTEPVSARESASQELSPTAQLGATERAPASGPGKIGLRSALAGLVLLTVGITALVIHLTWSYAARRNVAEVVGQLNLQIVGSVQHEIRDTLNDAWSVQEAVRSIFFQEAIKPTDEAKREFVFLALLRSHPTLSWIAIGFPDGGFF